MLLSMFSFSVAIVTILVVVPVGVIGGCVGSRGQGYTPVAKIRPRQQAHKEVLHARAHPENPVSGGQLAALGGAQLVGMRAGTGGHQRGNRHLIARHSPDQELDRGEGGYYVRLFVRGVGGYGSKGQGR
jgi:hypothetical protein